MCAVNTAVIPAIARHVDKARPLRSSLGLPGILPDGGSADRRARAAAGRCGRGRRAAASAGNRCGQASFERHSVQTVLEVVGHSVFADICREIDRRAAGVSRACCIDGSQRILACAPVEPRAIRQVRAGKDQRHPAASSSQRRGVCREPEVGHRRVRRCDQSQLIDRSLQGVYRRFNVSLCWIGRIQNRLGGIQCGAQEFPAFRRIGFVRHFIQILVIKPLKRVLAGLPPQAIRRVPQSSFGVVDLLLRSSRSIQDHPGIIQRSLERCPACGGVVVFGESRFLVVKRPQRGFIRPQSVDRGIQRRQRSVDLRLFGGGKGRLCVQLLLCRLQRSLICTPACGGIVLLLTAACVAVVNGIAQRKGARAFGEVIPEHQRVLTQLLCIALVQLLLAQRLGIDAEGIKFAVARAARLRAIADPQRVA